MLAVECRPKSTSLYFVVEILLAVVAFWFLVSAFESVLVSAKINQVNPNISKHSATSFSKSGAQMIPKHQFSFFPLIMFSGWMKSVKYANMCSQRKSDKSRLRQTGRNYRQTGERW